MSQTIRDIQVAGEWINAMDAVNALAADDGIPTIDSATQDVVINNKSDGELLVAFAATMPDNEDDRGETLKRFEKLVVSSEPLIWIKRFNTNETVNVHIGLEG